VVWTLLLCWTNERYYWRWGCHCVVKLIDDASTQAATCTAVAAVVAVAAAAAVADAADDAFGWIEIRPTRKYDDDVDCSFHCQSHCHFGWYLHVG
jgi:hypothetical protein